MSNGHSVTGYTQPAGKGSKIWVCLDQKREDSGEYKDLPASEKVARERWVSSTLPHPVGAEHDETGFSVHYCALV